MDLPSLPSIIEPPSRSEFISPDTPSKCTWYLGADPKTSFHNPINVLQKPKILPSALYAIGDTPLIRLNKIPEDYGIKCEIFKCEYFNIGGSVKDRTALQMIEDAEKHGKIKPGYTLIEPTSGNTGIGIALISAIKGYKCIIVIPENMSDEKVNCLSALGADVIRTRATAEFDDPESHFRLAQTLCQKIPNSYVLDQFRNVQNPLMHYHTTAEEILHSCDNQVDMVVAGMGTGGSLTGIGRKMKERCPNCKVVGVLPRYASKSLEAENLNGIYDYEVEGIGYNFSPTVLDKSVVDDWLYVDDKDTFQMARQLIRKEGILCGGSGGTAMCAALQAARDLEEGQKCVVIIADGNRNYMTGFISDSWMVERNYMDVSSAMEVNHWWWDKKVMALNLTPPPTISTQASCKDAVRIMRQGGLDHILVVDSHKVITGMISLKDLLKLTIIGRNISTCTVSEVQHKTFHKVNANSTLGKLTAVLESFSYALVVHNQRDGEDMNLEVQKCLPSKDEMKNLPYFLDKADKDDSDTCTEDMKIKQRAIGITTRMHLINYIRSKNRNKT